MIKDIPAVAEHLEKSVREFTDIAVVGVSGGVDSSVVASVCVRALGPDAVHLVSMPYDEVDQQTFNALSGRLALRLGAQHHVVSIGAACQPIEASLRSCFPGQPLDRLSLGNIRPRVRMTVLYAICGELGYKTGRRARVMGTGHLSEDLIGYDTKGGDALADIFILSDLLKSEVYQLAEYYGVESEIIHAAPSAGLYPGQTDAAELGFTYAELEEATLAVFELLLDGVEAFELNPSHPELAHLDRSKVEFVIRRYKANAHKHLAPATVSSRNPDWVD